MPRDSRPSPEQMRVIAAWLDRIAAATRDADAINHLHNNLVYWAGLNLAAIGTVTQRPDLIDAGIARAREGIRDIGPNGELQRELKRGDRALHYHDFALLPLVFVARLVPILAARRPISEWRLGGDVTGTWGTHAVARPAHSSTNLPSVFNACSICPDHG